MVSEFLREMGDVQGALAACDRALAACDRGSIRACRRACAPTCSGRAASCSAASGACAKRSTRTSTPSPCFAASAREGRRRARKTRSPTRFRARSLRGRDRARLESIQIDLSIGGRFQLAKTLTNIGQSYGKLGDLPRAAAYLKRARDAHEQYGDQDGRADTLVTSAIIAIDASEIDLAEQLLGDAAALTAATGNQYDAATRRSCARPSRARGEHRIAIDYAAEARRAAETQALVSFQFYALAWRPRRASTPARRTGRCSSRRPRSAPSTTCKGASRSRDSRRSAPARSNAPARRSPRTPRARRQVRAGLLASIRDPRLRRLFARRSAVASLGDAELALASAPRASLPTLQTPEGMHDVTIPNSAPSRRLAMILSGGGARGAYEVGVLSYIFDESHARARRPPRVDILSGTSVGAINALLPRRAPRRSGARPSSARAPVEELELREVLGFGFQQSSACRACSSAAARGRARGSST